MAIKNFIYDIRILKYKCILTYFHLQLIEAEKMTEEGKGEICVKNVDYVRTSILQIKEIMEETKCTYHEMVLQMKANPFLIPYYNTIGGTVRKHFSVTDPWIPSFLMIEVLRLFSEKNYNFFPNIDFLKLQEEFQRYENRKESNLPLHYKCAYEIFQSIDKKKVFSKKNKNKHINPKAAMISLLKQNDKLRKKIAVLEEENQKLDSSE